MLALASAQGGYSISEDGLSFIAEHEGIRYNLYNDPAGHCTIGIGHLVHKGNCDASDTSEQEFLEGITRDQAFELLRSDVAVAEQAVNAYVTVPLTQSQFDALVSFAYNVGSGNFKNSDLLTKLNKGEYDSVPSELNKWVHGGGKVLPGLITRRSDEGALFQSEGSATSASKQVTLTLYVHDGSASGPKITGAKVAGKDGLDNSFAHITGSNGYVTLKGDPGTWSFSASADGYETNSWDQEITQTCTKNAFLQESAASTFSLNLQEVNAEPNPAIPGSIVMIKATLSKENADDNGLNVIAVIKSPEGTEISKVSMKRVTGDAFQGIWNANSDAGIYKINLIASTDKATKTFENALEIILQKDKEAVTPTTKIPLTSQGSESSVVGKWKIHSEEECKLDNGEASSSVFDSLIEFHIDGTFTAPSEINGIKGTITGEWTQDGNVIRFQHTQSGSLDGGKGSNWQSESSSEGTIKGDTMSGTGLTVTHNNFYPQDPVNSHSIDIYCSDRWSASRVG